MSPAARVEVNGTLRLATLFGRHREGLNTLTFDLEKNPGLHELRSVEALNPTNVRNPCEQKDTNQDANGDDCGKKIVRHCLFSCSALSTL